MPFTIEQFLEVFKNYNLSVWPMQVAFYVMGIFMVVFGTRKAPASDKAIAFMLAFLWLWMGIVYHLTFFTAINKAAFLFGALFIIQGIFFLMVRNSIVFRFRGDIYGITGALLMLYALIIYPVWGYFGGHVYPASPTFGLPCPTTIFTLGMLLWANAKFPVYLIVIPLLWSLIGFFAAVSMGIAEDTGLLIAGLLTAFLFFKQKRTGGKA